MKNQAYKDAFLTLGGAAAGANVATIAASAFVSVVPMAVPVIGAIMLGGLGLFASRNDGPLFPHAKIAEPEKR